MVRRVRGCWHRRIRIQQGQPLVYLDRDDVFPPWLYAEAYNDGASNQGRYGGSPTKGRPALGRLFDAYQVILDQSN